MGAPFEKGMAWMVREHAYTNAGARIALINKGIIICRLAASRTRLSLNSRRYP